MFYKKIIILMFITISSMPIHGMNYIASLFKKNNQTTQKQDEIQRQKRLAYAYFQLALNDKNSELIFKLLKNADSQDLQRYLELLRDNLLDLKFYTWIFFRNEAEFIDQIMEKYPQSTALFRDFVFGNFHDFIENGQHALLEKILIKCPSLYKECITIISQNISKFALLLPDLICKIVIHNHECEMLLMPEILKNLDAITPFLLSDLVSYNSKLFGYNKIIKNLFNRIEVPKIFKFFIDDFSSFEGTPSGKHLINFHFSRGRFERTTDKFLNDPILENLLKQVIHKEQHNKQDYYTFVHGQRRAYYFPEKLYTFLWSSKTKQSIKDFFFAHVKDLAVTEEDLDSEEWRRAFVLTDGKFDRRSHVLFMNYALFANNDNVGSNSAYYILDNSNSSLGTFNLPASEPFKKLGYDAIYEQFKNEIELLHKEYNDLCEYGNLLFIAVPKDKIHEYVYLGMSGGHKTSVEIKDIGETNDIRLIIETLLNSPKKMKTNDVLEFCLVMTQKDGGLDPDTGIKIFPLVTGDPEKLAVLQKKEEALFAKIKAAIEKDEQEKEKQKAISRMAVVVNQLVPN